MSPSPSFSLLAEFTSFTKPCLPPQPVKHTVTHHIYTKEPPVHTRPRRLPPDRLRIALHEFEHTLEQEMIQPVIMTPTYGSQKDIWRPCGDYRVLESCYCSRQIPHTTHTAFYSNSPRLNSILQAKLSACLPPDSCRTIEHSKNCTIWIVRIPENALWLTKCCTDFSTFHGWLEFWC